MYSFICFQIFIVLPTTKLLLKYDLLIAVGLLRRASKEVFLQSNLSLSNHAGQESMVEAGPFFHHARMDK